MNLEVRPEETKKKCSPDFLTHAKMFPVFSLLKQQVKEVKTLRIRPLFLFFTLYWALFFFLNPLMRGRKKYKTDHDEILERKKWNGAVSCRFLFSWSFSGRNGCLAKSASICVQLRKRNLHSNVLICNEGKQE